jgi:hypothetical protein
MRDNLLFTAIFAKKWSGKKDQKRTFVGQQRKNGHRVAKDFFIFTPLLRNHIKMES